MEVMTEAINSHLDLQRYKNLFISGNCSRILSRLNRTSPAGCAPGQHPLPAHDHSGGEPP